MTIISSADLAILQHQQNSPASGRSGKDRVMEKRFDKYGYPAAREIVAGRQMNLSELEFIHLLQDELGIFELNRSVYGKKPMTQITVFNLERKPLFHTDMVAISGLTCSELPYLIRDCVYDIGNKLEGIKVDDSTTMHLILSLFSKQRYTIERAAEPDHGTVLELARKLFSGAILQDDEMWLRLQRWYEAEIHDVPFDVLPLKDLAAIIRTVLRETPPDQGRNTSGVHADKPGPEFTKRTDVRDSYFKVWAFVQKRGNAKKTISEIVEATGVNKNRVPRILADTRPPTPEEIESKRTAKKKR